jgi:transposase-like protein
MKGKGGIKTVYKDVFYGTALYNRRTMNDFKTILNFSKSDSAQLRLSVINFHNKHGTKATCDAYGISKSTIYEWKKRYRESKHDLNSLIPKSKVPIHKRKMEVKPLVLEFIKNIRIEHFGIGKEKIKPLLDEYCLENDLKTICESKIGKIIKRYDLVFPVRVYHDPTRKKHVFRDKVKVRYSPKIKDVGYIEIDSITKFVEGMRLYVINAKDIKLKFQFAYSYTRLNSRSALDLFKKLEEVYPIKEGIKIVQTDNGSEFEGEFDRYLKEKNIPHVYIYPRCPKINSFVERSNRSLQEEFIDSNISTFLLKGIDKFNLDLMDHLIWYNTKRVHKSLGNITPIHYVFNLLPQSSMYGTRTYYFIFIIFSVI